jgi:hypothetical protein
VRTFAAPSWGRATSGLGANGEEELQVPITILRLGSPRQPREGLRLRTVRHPAPELARRILGGALWALLCGWGAWTSPLAAQVGWTLLGPPGQGGISSFAVSSESARWMVAATAAGSTLFATEDGGATWAPLPMPPTEDDNSFALQIAIDPQAPARIFLASQGFSLGGHSINGLFHSLDDGRSWTRLAAPGSPAWVTSIRRMRRFSTPGRR